MKWRYPSIRWRFQGVAIVSLVSLTIIVAEQRVRAGVSRQDARKQRGGQRAPEDPVKRGHSEWNAEFILRTLSIDILSTLALCFSPHPHILPFYAYSSVALSPLSSACIPSPFLSTTTPPLPHHHRVSICHP